MEKPSMIKPAIIGGLIVGVPWALPIFNLLCCGWALIGGAVAAKIYVKESRVPITSGNGAALGALTGFVGGVILTVITVISFFISNPDPEAFTEKLRAFPFLDPNAVKFMSEN